MATAIASTIGNRLQDSRESRGLSVEEASRQAGVSADDWKKWESNELDMPLFSGVRVSQLLGICPSWLATGECEVNP